MVETCCAYIACPTTEHGARSMLHGAWHTENGACSMLHGAWRTENAARSMAHGEWRTENAAQSMAREACCTWPNPIPWTYRCRTSAQTSCWCGALGPRPTIQTRTPTPPASAGMTSKKIGLQCCQYRVPQQMQVVTLEDHFPKAVGAAAAWRKFASHAGPKQLYFNFSSCALSRSKNVA
jgi:hypothetical protein